jgi:hypothetical protein
MTRAIRQILCGNFELAYRYNPVSFLFFPAVFAIAISFLVTKKLQNSFAKGVLFIFSGILILVWVYRLVTVFPSDDIFTFNNNSLFSLLLNL